MSRNVQSAVLAAKKRMKSGYWAMRANGITPSAQHDEQMEKMYLVVQEMMESDEIIINPLSRIMDDNYYASLDDKQKSCYILELARVYNELKNRYYDSKKVKAQ